MVNGGWRALAYKAIFAEFGGTLFACVVGKPVTPERSSAELHHEPIVVF